MPRLAAFTDPLREYFTQRRAEQAVRGYQPAQHAQVRALRAAGDVRAAAGRRVALAVPAAELLREAVAHYLRAAAVARDPRLADAILELAELELPELPPDPARPRATPTDHARAAAALSARDPLYLDGLAPEDAERTRWALDRAATLLRGRLEARSVLAVRITRWGRYAGLALLVLWGLSIVVRAKLLPRNVALGKPVHPSSVHVPTLDGHELVDGDVGTSYAIHTNEEDNASVTIDLEQTFWIQAIRVYNRVDGWFDDCLPLVVELSKDGHAYEQLARRETHFGSSPPWTIDAGGRGARYVRVRVARHGYLAISEVEVLSKP